MLLEFLLLLCAELHEWGHVVCTQVNTMPGPALNTYLLHKFTIFSKTVPLLHSPFLLIALTGIWSLKQDFFVLPLISL